MKKVETSGLRALLAAYMQRPDHNQERALALADALDQVGLRLVELEQGPAPEEWAVVAPVLEEFLGVNKAYSLTAGGAMKMIPAYDSHLKWVSPIGIRCINLWGSHVDYTPEEPIARVVFDDGSVAAILVRQLAASGVELPRMV